MAYVKMPQPPVTYYCEEHETPEYVMMQRRLHGDGLIRLILSNEHCLICRQNKAAWQLHPRPKAAAEYGL